MTYNEFLKAVSDRYLEHVEKKGADNACLCAASISVTTIRYVDHYRRLHRAIEMEVRTAYFLHVIWKKEGRYGILPPKGRKDTHRKRLKRIVAARLQWLANQAE